MAGKKAFSRYGLPGLAWMLIFWAMATAVIAEEEPRVLHNQKKRLHLLQLPDLPSDEEVRPHLMTGLTTSFAFRVSLRSFRGGDTLGGARIEIRYDLWDEVFRVEAIGFDGSVEQQALPSFDGLLAWWHQLDLILTEPLVDLPRPARARVNVDILPFSESERADTQQWFADGLGADPESGTEAAAQVAEDPAEPIDRVLHLLMATSIQRKALLSFRFVVPVEPT